MLFHADAGRFALRGRVIAARKHFNVVAVDGWHWSADRHALAGEETKEAHDRPRFRQRVQDGMADAQVVPAPVYFKAEDDVVVLAYPAYRGGIALPEFARDGWRPAMLKAVALDMPLGSHRKRIPRRQCKEISTSAIGALHRAIGDLRNYES